MDREAAKKSLGFQLTRMTGENLLGELADRGCCPDTAFRPTSCRSSTRTSRITTKAKPTQRQPFSSPQLSVSQPRHRNSRLRAGRRGCHRRTGFKSAGVTLNWKRPAGASDVHQIQSLKWHWQCQQCGDAGTSVLKPSACVACDAEIEPDAAMRFLRPAGFTVDMTKQPHAEIDEVAYVEPEPERVSAHGAEWRPLLDASRGRMRRPATAWSITRLVVESIGATRFALSADAPRPITIRQMSQTPSR